MEVEKLIKVAEEMQKLMSFEEEPPLDGDEKALTKWITMAAKEIDYETDDFTMDTKIALVDLDLWEGDEQPDDGAVDEDSLPGQIEAAGTLKDLKLIVKNNDEFKAMRSQLTKYKTFESLQEALLDMLETTPEEPDPEPEEEKHTPPPRKTAKKDTPKKEPKAKAPTKKTGGITKDERLEQSSVVKGMSVGSKVMFTTAPNSRVAPNVKQRGEVIALINSVKAQQEVARIKTSKGIFHKNSKSVELVK